LAVYYETTTFVIDLTGGINYYNEKVRQW